MPKRYIVPLYNVRTVAKKQIIQLTDSGLKNKKRAWKNVKNPGKSCFAVRKEWVK